MIATVHVLDLQAAHFQSYDRPLQTLGRLLGHADLQAVNKTLTQGLDLKAFLEASGPGRGAAWSAAAGLLGLRVTCSALA